MPHSVFGGEGSPNPDCHKHRATSKANLQRPADLAEKLMVCEVSMEGEAFTST